MPISPQIDHLQWYLLNVRLHASRAGATTTGACRTPLALTPSQNSSTSTTWTSSAVRTRRVSRTGPQSFPLLWVLLPSVRMGGVLFRRGERGFCAKLGSSMVLQEPVDRLFVPVLTAELQCLYWHDSLCTALSIAEPTSALGYLLSYTLMDQASLAFLVGSCHKPAFEPAYCQLFDPAGKHLLHVSTVGHETAGMHTNSLYGSHAVICTLGQHNLQCSQSLISSDMGWMLSTPRGCVWGTRSLRTAMSFLPSGSW